jgi:hypothetical protein
MNGLGINLSARNRTIVPFCYFDSTIQSLVVRFNGIRFSEFSRNYVKPFYKPFISRKVEKYFETLYVYFSRCMHVSRCMHLYHIIFFLHKHLVSCILKLSNNFLIAVFM